MQISGWNTESITDMVPV
ncbi:MAG: hypothetical protein J1E98_08025 [Lachnospiraceae bacterium]|nr:hypothetical protein [Lachnospiraceae bacterium]